MGRGECLVAAGGLFRAAVLQFRFGEKNADGTGRDVDFDDVTVADQGDVAAGRRFRGDVADGKAGGAAAETAVGQQYLCICYFMLVL